MINNIKIREDLYYSNITINIKKGCPLQGEVLKVTWFYLQGYTTTEITLILEQINNRKISHKTVQTYLSRAKDKLNCFSSTRWEFFAKANKVLIEYTDIAENETIH